MDANLAKRIRGEVISTGANNPIILDDPNTLLIVKKGFLDIFVIGMRDNQTFSRKPFVTRLAKGMAAFGHNPVTIKSDLQGTERYCLAAIPSQGSQIILGELAAISSEKGFGIDSIIWIDEWVTELSAFLVRMLDPPPRRANLIEADPDVEYPAGVLTALHRDIVWVSANRPITYIGNREVFNEKDQPLIPITSQTWLTLPEPTKITAVYTPTAFVSGKLWPSLDAFGRQIIMHGEEVWKQGTQLAEERYHESLKSQQESLGTVHKVLAGILPSKATPKENVLWPPTHWWNAVDKVVQSNGNTIEMPSIEATELVSTEQIIASLHATGVRTRRLQLGPEWWQKQGSAFLGFTRKEQRPIALLPNPTGRYRYFDPLTNTTTPINRKEVAEISHSALMLYSPLSTKTTSGTEALANVFRGFQKEYILLLIITALGGAVALVTPVITGHILAYYIPRSDLNLWVSGLSALVLGTLTATLLELAGGFTILRILGQTDERLQAAIWIKLLSLPALFFKNFTIGDLASRADGISRVRETVTTSVAGAFTSIFVAIFAASLLFWYSWVIAIFVYLLAAGFIGTTVLFSFRQIKHHRKEYRLIGDIDGLVFQIINGLNKLRVANSESHALAKWAKLFAEQKKEALAAHKWAAGHMAFNGIYFPLSMIVVFTILALITINDSGLDVATFISFNAALGIFLVALINLSIACVEIASSIPLLERIKPILDAKPEKDRARPYVDPGALRGNIEFSAVDFSYHPDLPKALDEISFRVIEGDSVAFVGSSGSGKSTILRLLIGFETANSGSIFLDGNNIDSLNMAATRSRMGIVMQFGYLFADNIYNNIAGYTKLSDEDAWEALRAVGLENEIKSMPMGIRTILSENGGGLSGGQKQRLLIARALAHRPSILLLDEATSSLDNKSQATVHNSLKTMNTTSIIIAHRLSTVRNVDMIHVLDNGKIIESGHYEKLMELDGAFARLVQRQLAEEGG